MDQLPIIFAASEQGIRRFFEAALGRPVELVLTDNRTRMLSARRRGCALALRLSRAFLSAPEEVLEEAARFIERGGGPTPLVARFLKSLPAPMRRARRENVRTRGRHRDLAPVFDRINREYFGGAVEAAVTWSRRVRGRVRRRTLGSYSASSGIVRINPVLDNPAVPEVFLEYIVYHEMLHAVVEVREKGGRRAVHPREFREREKEFRGYGEAMAWERANKRLL